MIGGTDTLVCVEASTDKYVCATHSFGPGGSTDKNKNVCATHSLASAENDSRETIERADITRDCRGLMDRQLQTRREDGDQNMLADHDRENRGYHAKGCKPARDCNRDSGHEYLPLPEMDAMNAIVIREDGLLRR
jgi:hypothetical protein